VSTSSRAKINDWLHREVARGRRAFIWRWGVLRAGVAFGVADALASELWRGDHFLSPPWLSLVVRFLAFVPLGALGFGAVFGWMWWGWISALAEDDSGPAHS
jgi:hypothetical protein